MPRTVLPKNIAIEAAQALAALRDELPMSAWQPLRQSVAVDESHRGWWWKLGLALLPTLGLLGVLLLAAAVVPPATQALHEQRIEVVFIERHDMPARAVPDFPSAPAALRLPRQLRLPQVSVPTPPDQPVPADTAVPKPSTAMLLRSALHQVRRAGAADPGLLVTPTAPELPGRRLPFIVGIQLRDRASPQQRVQMVLGLIGLGQVDPCPDIQRHVQSAIAVAQDGRRVDGELRDWLRRAEHCQR